MKIIIPIIAFSIILLIGNNQSLAATTASTKYQRFDVCSHRDNLNLALHQYDPTSGTIKGSILLVHGSSFPSKLSFSFKLENDSWQDYFNRHGIRVYMLDFLGYGDADRYPEMISEDKTAPPLGELTFASIDVENAVNFILEKDKLESIHLLGHSWGSNVAAHFAQRHPGKVKTLTLYASIYPDIAIDKNVSVESKPITAYSELSAKARLDSMSRLAIDEPLLADEMYHNWPKMWFDSDPLARLPDVVKYPSGPKLDIQKIRRGQALFDANKIVSDTLVIRGEYDKFPTHEQAHQLFSNLTSTERKQYVIIGKGTHVLHLEKHRRQLYQQVLSFILKTGH